MLKFFFHIRDGETVVQDEEGVPLRDWTAIKIEGHKSAWDVARQYGSHSSNCSIEVVDQFGTIVDRIPIAPVHELPC